MRISDWSSDVCSSDLFETFRTGGGRSRDLPPHPQAERRAFRPHRARRGSAMTDTRGPLGWRLKLAYAGGQLVEGIANNSLSVFLLFYVTAVCGLPGALAGAALAAWMVVDAVMNPIIGSLTDGWRSRFGRRLPRS